MFFFFKKKTFNYFKRKNKDKAKNEKNKKTTQLTGAHFDF